MGTGTYGGQGFRERIKVSGERQIGAASMSKQPTQASCQPENDLPRNS